MGAEPFDDDTSSGHSARLETMSISTSALRTLLSFEGLGVLNRALGSARADLENSIVVSSEFFTIKRLRAHGGCLGAKSRRRTWAAAISPGEVLTDL